MRGPLVSLYFKIIQLQTYIYYKYSFCFRSNQLSVCCDNKIVSVFGIEKDFKLNLAYENRNLHNNYVRGMVWDTDNDNVLYTVAWDGQMKQHVL